MDKQAILKHYLVALLWASTDDNGNPLDDNYSLEDISEELKESSLKDIELFLSKTRKLIINLSDEQIGHDIFLTRNRHGAGFWDRECLSKSMQDLLTVICHDLKEVNAYVNDNKVYID